MSGFGIGNSGLSSVGAVSRDKFEGADGGYELTGGFTDRTTGTAGASALGSNVSYTQAMADAGTWLRFGLDASQQETNDSPYWSDPTPGPHEGIGLFGGRYMPCLLYTSDAADE